MGLDTADRLNFLQLKTLMDKLIRFVSSVVVIEVLNIETETHYHLPVLNVTITVCLQAIASAQFMTLGMWHWT
jgi:hypothetical protein